MGGFLGLKAQSDHRFAAENLSAYLDGQLTVHEKERVERHLAACADCRQELATLHKTVALLRQAPIRPVPRSFTLPLAVQAEQAQHRRWNKTYAFMRGATAVVSLLLVLLISGDVLLGQSIASIPGLSSPRAYSVMATAPAGAAPAGATEPMAALQAEAAAGAAETEPQVQALQVPAAIEDQPAEESAQQGDTLSGGGTAPAAEPTTERAGEDSATTLPEDSATTLPEDSATTLPEDSAIALPTETPQAEGEFKSAPLARSLSATPAGEATPEENLATNAPEADGETEGTVALLQAPQQPESEAPEQSERAATAADNAQAEAQGEGYAGETAAPAEAAEQAAKMAPERKASATAYNLSPLWSLWQIVRTGALALAGLLLALIGGLLWSGYKRRV